MRLGLLFLAALAFSGGAAAQTLTPEQIKAIVASPDRTPADLTNDKRRHPEDILAFLALKPGLVALDVSAADATRPVPMTRANSIALVFIVLPSS